MSNEFDIKTFYNNIYILIKLKKLKVGNVENDIGLPVGYLSRRKRDLKPMPLDKAFSISKYLGYTIDYLCSKDLGIELKKKQIMELEEQIERLKRQVG